MLTSDIVVYLTYGNQQTSRVSLLVKRCLGMGVDFVHIGAWWGRLILAYIAVKSGLFRVLAFIRPTTCGEHFSSVGADSGRFLRLDLM